MHRKINDLSLLHPPPPTLTLRKEENPENVVLEIKEATLQCHHSNYVFIHHMVSLFSFINVLSVRI